MTGAWIPTTWPPYCNGCDVDDSRELGYLPKRIQSRRIGDDGLCAQNGGRDRIMTATVRKVVRAD